MRLAISCVVLLIAYFVSWGIWYRIVGVEPSSVIDLRSANSHESKCITFCGSLASNPHGFPGHAYVAWSEAPPADFAKVASTGYVPFRPCDQVPSLVSDVRGYLVDHASAGNQRSLITLSVLVDADRFEHARGVSLKWNEDVFRVGVRDCVRYTDTIARDLGLKTPNAAFRFPQDYVRELKALNAYR